MPMRIDIPAAELATICARWQIVELSLFGSVLRDDFRPDSDVDLLVRFAPGARHTLFDMTRIEDDFSRLFGRSVDLVERPAIENGRNPLRRRAILDSAETVYAA